MALRLITYPSIASLLEVAPAWDDLWKRSDLTLPTAGAELMAQWLEHFAPSARFQCVAIQDGGELVAGLPLIERRIGRVLRTGAFPRNDWSAGGGEFLLDPTTDVSQALDLIVEGLKQMPWPLLWLDDVELDAPRNQALLSAFQRSSTNVDVHPRFKVGRVATDGNWQDYQQGRSRNFRRHIKRAIKRAEGDGQLDLKVQTQFSSEELESQLRRAFEIEDRGWKGDGQTSVLKAPGMFEFFVKQARKLAQAGQLQLSFLEHNARPIAFEYGLNSKGVYHSFKVGYDEACANYSPGRVLLHLIAERLFESPQSNGIDFIGPLTASTTSCSTSTYTIGRMAVAPKAMLGRAFMNIYKSCWPTVRRVRQAIQRGITLPGVKSRSKQPRKAGAPDADSAQQAADSK